MFKPKNEKPYWEMVYDYIVDLPVETVIKYSELSKVLDEDIKENRSAVYRACKQLIEQKKRSLKVVRGIGYEVVEGMELLYDAENRHNMAKRHIVKAEFETSNIDTVKLTPDERTKLQNFMSFNANIRMAFEQKINRIEKASQVTELAQQLTREEIGKLKDLLGTK